MTQSGVHLGESRSAAPVRPVVLAVACAPEELRALGDSVRGVANYMMALGELGVHGPVEMIVGPMGSPESMGATIQSLRELSPGAKLVAAVAAGEQYKAEAERARALGFDAAVARPVSSDALRQALHVAGSTSAPTPASDADLGDVDLVEHLLTRKPALVELALRLMRAKSGWTDLRWRAEDREVSGWIGATVQQESRVLGRLELPIGTGVPLEAIEPWAQWLARWLALETQLQGLWTLALTDELTGAYNRRYFNRFLEMVLARAASERFRVTLMIFDIDDFKLYNDRHGHAAGDEILRETARLMRSVVRAHDVVARIGGDEFAVIFWDAREPRKPLREHPQDVRQAAERFQRAIWAHRFPKLGQQAAGTLTISGGLASFPWDGRTPAELMEKADAMLLRSKAQGKNVLTFGPGALRDL